ncbi:MAG: NifU family protein [Deltaproteobacteria bacterium]|nr:NifU family protein [Deltaproteobacteria bacterium]MBW2421831.1 NifU family protein [Deltaproteobacteria bacterium]
MDSGLRMHAERTPNPDSVKWVLSVPVVQTGERAQFSEQPAAGVSPLAQALFSVPGVSEVYLGSDFVTVSKRPELEWGDLAEAIVGGIKEWAQSGALALGPAYEAPRSEAGGEAGGEIVQRIVEILERDIRPYVAQDGGEIRFAGYRDGVVEVYLQGACSGCPSSSITLKMGIEARLKEEIPEVKEVVAL